MRAAETLTRANTVIRAMLATPSGERAGPAIFDLGMAFALAHPELARAAIAESSLLAAHVEGLPAEMVEQRQDEVRSMLVALIAGELS